MFKVYFRNADSGRDIYSPVYLDELPAKGERVEIRQRAADSSGPSGVVTDRQWYVVAGEGAASDVVVFVALD